MTLERPHQPPIGILCDGGGGSSKPPQLLKHRDVGRPTLGQRSIDKDR